MKFVEVHICIELNKIKKSWNHSLAKKIQNGHPKWPTRAIFIPQNDVY